MRKSDPDERALAQDEESLLGRWSRRKHEARNNDEETKEQENTVNIESIKPAALTDADMPPIESLNEDSDYSGFLSPRVSETLRKQALHKLFHSPAFHIRDGLDDYDGIYTEFEKLGDIITADMRHQMEMETRRQLQQLAEQQSSEEIEQIEVDSVSPDVSETDTVIPVHDMATEESIDDSDAIDDEEVEL
ncbi:MAG: DUF3306 domain-containing protein [Thiohalomonadales bacterium]|nr:DUF3306 domain-containing protein [Thiohalomonadales bacterium]